MQINIGSPERALRLALGLLALVLPFVLGVPAPWRWIAVAVGVVLIGTAALRFCPAWALLGISTARRK